MSGRRGFAMPLAIVITLVVTGVVSLIMTRSVLMARTARRQADAYQLQHGARGLQSLLSAWLGTQQASGFEEMLDDGDGFAMSVLPGDGTELRIWFRPGQGRLLDDWTVARGDAREDLERANEFLLRDPRAAGGGLTRSVGPIAVDAGTAPEAVLRAVLRAAGGLDAAAAGSVAEEIVDLRDAAETEAEEAEGGGLEPSALREALAETTLTDERRARVLALMTAEPTTWEMTAEIRGRVVQAGRVLAAYRALVRVPESADAAPEFLTWEDLLADPNRAYVPPDAAGG